MDANATTKPLLEWLQSDDEATRLQAVADLVFRTETHVRNLTLMLLGLLTKAKGDVKLMRDLLAAEQASDAAAEWLGTHYKVLFARIDQLEKSAGTATELEPDTRTVH